MTRSEWVRDVARLPLTTAGRLVAGALADRADRTGRVKVSTATLASCTCLPITITADAVADLASHGMLARDGRDLVLTTPGSAR